MRAIRFGNCLRVIRSCDLTAASGSHGIGPSGIEFQAETGAQCASPADKEVADVHSGGFPQG
jgi:hypothetical protein